MTTNLPISHGRSLPIFGYSTAFKMFTYARIILICLICSTLTISVKSQVLNADGVEYEIDYTGGYEEFTIPDAANLNGKQFVSFFTKGGDGGKRKVGTLLGKGGGGAKASGTFEIGTSPGDLKPGARIRFIVGQKGANDVSGRVAGAGGGGGTGIIYTEAASDDDITCHTVSTNLSDAASCWVILVVGGGGGGAFGSGFGVYGGKSGRDDESGGDGNGTTNFGPGGQNGNGGSAVNAAGPVPGGGGGAKSGGQIAFSGNSDSENGKRGNFDGGEGGDRGDVSKKGGFGYGGGGAGIHCACTTGAGGGGGYSGGGGGELEGGGGGGSFVNSSAIFTEKKDGNRDGSPDHGRIRYQFVDEVSGVIAKCKDLEVTLVNGSYTMVPSDLDDGSIVEVGESISLQIIDPFSFSRTFTCADIGEQLVTYIIVSTSGDSDDCTAIVEVLDGEAPSLTCPSTTITATVTQSQDHTINLDNLGISTSDDCGGPVELSLLDEVLTCADLGLQTITVFGEDESGNIGSCDVMFNVVANTETANITCPANVTVGLGNAGNCPALVMADQLEPVVEGPCTSELTYNIANTNGEVFASGTGVLGDTEFPMPTNVVTYTFGANSLLTPQSCSFTVSLQGSFSDDILLQCQDNLTFDLDADDNCSISLNEGLIIPFYYACFESVEGNFTYTAPNGQVTTAPSFDGFFPGGLTFGVGISEVSFTGFYGSLSETCSFTVTVNDVTPPVAQCKDLTIVLEPDECAVSVPFSSLDNGSSDDCGNLEFLVPGYTDCSSGTCISYPTRYADWLVGAGTHTVSFTVRDQSGNTSSCTQIVTLIDETPPMAVCQNVTVNLSNPVLQAADLDAGSSDNCASATPLEYHLLMTDNGNSPIGSSLTVSCSDVGSLNLTLEITDGSGHSSNCNAVVMVVDDVLPSVSCQDYTVQLNDNGVASIQASDIGSATDACGITSEVLNQYNFDCNHLSSNPTVTYTATDINGNNASCTAIITVEDNLAPTVQCMDVSVNLDNNGIAQLSVNGLDNGSTDNCEIVSTSWTPMSFNCSDVGTVSVTQTFTDASGNSSSCTQTVTINDFTVPTAVCSDFTAPLDASGNATITIDDIDGGSTDACGLDSRVLSKTSFTCSDAGPQTVTLTLTDPSGNSSNCDATVTVVDNIAPTALCKNINLPLGNIGQASIIPSDIDDGSGDNCSLTPSIVNPSYFDCSDVGPNTVLLTVTDVNGNTATCTSTVTVIDDMAPNVLCQDIEVVLNENGQGTALVGDAFDSHSYDACGPLMVSFASENTVSSLAFDCSHVGDNAASVYASDVNGNVSLPCLINITVKDEMAPDAQCQNINLQLDVGGKALITPSNLDNGSTDACSGGNLSFQLSKSFFDCGNVGSTLVTMTVVDESGNSSSCQSTVNVEDDVAPVAACKDLTVVIDANELTITISPQQIDNGSNDACGISQFYLNQNTFDCDDEGINTITLNVIDNHGNQSTCNAILTVEIDDALPNSWSTSDIGMQSIGNEYAFEPCGITSGQFSVIGSGNNVISNTTDNVAFAHQSLCSDGYIIAKIENIDPNGYGGLMIRETTDAGSKQVAVFSNLTNILRHEVRYTTNNFKQVNSFFKPSPIWLKLERQGDWVFSYYSSTGSNFQYVHGVYLPMQACVEIGLASFTYFSFAQTEAVFSNVTIIGNNSGFSANVPTPQHPLPNETNKPSWDKATTPIAYTIFPNPTNSEFIVQSSDILGVSKTLQLFNANGHLVRTRILPTGQQKLRWNIHDLPQGVYWLRTKGEHQLHKIVISR